MHKHLSNRSAFVLSLYGKKYFMLDPNERTIDFIQFLSTEYSRRGLTVKTDRSTAISGLESRIAQAKKCETRFGIFELFLHRPLLWQRTGKRDTDRIDYGAQIVPSWSWMAYNGSIKFMDIPFHSVEWVRSLRFNKRYKYRRFNEKWKPALVTDMSSFRTCNFERRTTDYAILDLYDAAERGCVQYDMETHERLDSERCVVIGRICYSSDTRERRKYYILVVRPTGMKNEYTRVGAGWIQGDYVARQDLEGLIV
jgi:hypothetical protein